VEKIISNLIDSLVFIFQRINWLSVVDIALVALIFFVFLLLLRESHAMVLLRGVLLLVTLVSLLTSLDLLPAFSWLVTTTLPALVLAIPVIFAPEIRRGLERLGRAGTGQPGSKGSAEIQSTITAAVNSALRLSDRGHGALIVLRRLDSLDEYVRTGVALDAKVTTDLLLQVFYPNTPLHDGAVIIRGDRVAAAACFLPLSGSPHLPSDLGTRHRAGIGITEHSDAVAVIISEETGYISLAVEGVINRHLDEVELSKRLTDLLYNRPSYSLTALLFRR